MAGLLDAMQGFAVIGIVIAVGYVAARMRVGGSQAQMVLNRMSFFVATPCLIFSILSRERLTTLLHPSIVVAFVAALTVGALFLLCNRLWFHLRAPDAAIGALGALYLNSNNIGLPVATYILGNPALVVPIVMMQWLIFMPAGLAALDATTRGTVCVRAMVLQPLRQPILIGSVLGVIVMMQWLIFMPAGLAALDATTRGTVCVRAMVLQPLRQPILIGSVLGVIVSAINARVGFDVVPAFVRNPIGMIGDAAVPMILMAFGMSLRGARPLDSRSGRAAALTVVALKNLVMPAVAFAMAYWVMGFRGPVLYACVVLAALPTGRGLRHGLLGHGVPRARAVRVRRARRAADRAERLQLRRQLQRGRRVFARLHPRQHHRQPARDRRDRARPRLVVGAGGDTGQTRRGAVRRGRRVFARLHPRQHHRQPARDRRDRARPRLVVGAGGDTGQTRRGAVRGHRAHQHERVTQRHSPDEADERARLGERIAHERREQQQ